MYRRLMAIGLFILMFLLVPVHALASTVIIDAGHGGSDPGAVGVNGLREKDVNLDIAIKLKEELLKRGYQVVMTRESDTFLSLQERVERARASSGELFVSIHSNAHTDKKASGSLVLYYDHRFPQSAYPPSSEMAALSPESGELASKVLSGLLDSIDTVDLGIVPSAAYVIRNGRVPSILVETAFISNAHDAAILASAESRKAIAIGIADGIKAYQPPVFIDIGRHWAKAHVLHLKQLGVVHGYEGKFNPDRSMTRAEFVTLLDHVFRFDEKLAEQPPANDSLPAFADLDASHWAYPQLANAAKLGILGGYEDGTLRPNEPLNRAEMAVILERVAMLKSEHAASETIFPDVPPDSWFAPAVHTLHAYSLIGGREDGEYNPQDPMTRAEASTVLDRYLSSPQGLAVLERLKTQHLM